MRKGIVFIPKDCESIADEIDRLLYKYDVNSKTQPYKMYLSKNFQEVIRRKMNLYTNSDWMSFFLDQGVLGGLDEQGAYQFTTCNARKAKFSKFRVLADLGDPDGFHEKFDVKLFVDSELGWVEEYFDENGKLFDNVNPIFEK